MVFSEVFNIFCLFEFSPNRKEGLSFLENYEAQNDNFMKYPTTLVFPKEEYDESTSIGSASTSFSGSSSLSSSRKNSATFNTEQLLSIPQTALENPSSTFFGEAAMLSSSLPLPSLRPSQVQTLSASKRLLLASPEKEGSTTLQQNSPKPARSSSRVSSMYVIRFSRYLEM